MRLKRKSRIILRVELMYDIQSLDGLSLKNLSSVDSVTLEFPFLEEEVREMI